MGDIKTQVGYQGHEPRSEDHKLRIRKTNLDLFDQKSKCLIKDTNHGFEIKKKNKRLEISYQGHKPKSKGPKTKFQSTKFVIRDTNRDLEIIKRDYKTKIFYQVHEPTI